MRTAHLKFALAVELLLLGCSASGGIEADGHGGAGVGGAPAQAGAANSSGRSGSGTAGSPVVNGGSNSNGGSAAEGGAIGGSATTGGAASGGRAGVGGSASGGRAGAGGSASGGRAGAGGSASGGRAGAGGSANGGQTGTGGGAAVNCSAPALTGGTQHCSSNATGTSNGFAYSIWSSGSGGCITTYGVGAAFKATWNNSGDFLAGMGFQWNETKKYDQYGTVSADYSYTKTGSGGGWSYIGIYGWSNSPLIEFYIVDDWFGSNPPNGGGTQKGTFDVDGATYKIYTHQQVNQPSIHGTTTFTQYFSVRQTARQCGHISVTEHFKKWADLGMPLGVMASARLLAEAGGGSGSIDYKVATMTAQ
jgi:endo-1,4-beta-xylanase